MGNLVLREKLEEQEAQSVAEAERQRQELCAFDFDSDSDSHCDKVTMSRRRQAAGIDGAEEPPRQRPRWAVDALLGEEEDDDDFDDELTKEQMGQYALDYMRVTITGTTILPAEGMVGEISTQNLADSILPVLNVRDPRIGTLRRGHRAITMCLQAPTAWASHETGMTIRMRDAAVYAAASFKTVMSWKMEPLYKNRANRLGDGQRMLEPNVTQNQKSLTVVLPVVSLLGPEFSYTKTMKQKEGTIESMTTIDEDEMNAYIRPLTLAFCQRSGIHDHSYDDAITEVNVHSYIKDLQRKMERGVYSWEYLKPKLNKFNTANYDPTSNFSTKTQGVPYEIASVMNYWIKNWPLPQDDLLFITDAQKEMLKAGQLYYPGTTNLMPQIKRP